MLRPRFRLPQAALAELFGVVTPTIVKAEQQIRPLLDQRGHVNPAPEHRSKPWPTYRLRPAHGVTLTPKTKPAVNNRACPTSCVSDVA